MTAKTDLRRQLRARRSAFVREPGAMQSPFVASLFVAERVKPHLAGAGIVAAYVSDGEEVDPLPILFQALDLGLDLALPRVTSREAPISFHRWLPGDELVPGLAGLLQPRADALLAEPDLILAPLVGFDRRLNRLGQGAGHYDRAFASRPAARRIGLAWSVQEVDGLDPDPWDVPLHGIATEREWIE